MGIADDELHTSQASLHQALQEGTPVDFLLAERYGKSQFLSFSIEGNPAGNQHGCIPDLLIKPALFVQGILVLVDNCTRHLVAPGVQAAPFY